ncbi:MAG: hypothetical protein RBT69_10390, partial [Spirochaetia bacterium]|nr:hypothetical protein [Spirochaetia bacterium]
MKKIISSPSMLFLSIFLLTGLFYTGCDSSGGGGGSITAKDVIGTWIKVWNAETPFELPSGTEADALIFDIGESDLQAVFYQNTEQVGGFKGTYAISDDEIVVTATHTWNEDWSVQEEFPVWEPSSEKYRFPAAPGSSGLTITISDDSITMEKITFGKPTVLSDPENGWVESGDGLYYLHFYPEGDFVPEHVGCNYHYEEGNNWKNGTWDASGTAEGYIRTVITVDNLLRVQINWGFLNQYNYYEG